MRHLFSVLLALVLAPLIYLSAGLSAIKFTDARGPGQGVVLPALLALAAALFAGGLYALLLMSRLSPAGPVLAGLLYLGVTLWTLFDVQGFTGATPYELFGVRGLVRVPAGFGTALLAVPLLVTVFNGGRWRGEPPTEDDYPTRSADR
jgi:hypothetical protein